MGGSMSQAVVIRKFEDGIAIYLDPDMDFEALLDQVGRKFSSAARFFRDACLAVSFEGRTLTRSEEDRLTECITQHSRLRIACILKEGGEKGRVFARAMHEYTERESLFGSTGRFYRGSLRRGQILETETGIVIIGNVEAGSCVIAGGSIVVIGSLRGSAYAGHSGKDFIAALEMNPKKLKIGDFKYTAEEKGKKGFLPTYSRRISRFFDGRRNGHSRVQPQKAYVEKNRMILKQITNESLSSLTQQ